MERITTNLEVIFWFDGDGDMKFKANSKLDDSSIELITEIVRPFCKLPGNRDRLLERGAMLRIKTKFVDGELEWLGVGFTTNATLTTTTTMINN